MTLAVCEEQEQEQEERGEAPASATREGTLSWRERRCALSPPRGEEGKKHTQQR